MGVIRTLKVSDKIPDVQFFVKNGAKFDSVNSIETFESKRVLVLGIPGAYWTDYPSSMISGYDYHFQRFQELGIDEIFVTTTNDGYVLRSWFKDLGIKNLKALPDGNGDWAKSVGFCIDMTESGLGYRSHRYAMILEDCLLKKLFYEDLTHDPHTCFTETNAESVLTFIEENQNTWYQFSNAGENHGRV
jgi:peroxiredoxin